MFDFKFKFYVLVSYALGLVPAAACFDKRLLDRHLGGDRYWMTGAWITSGRYAESQHGPPPDWDTLLRMLPLSLTSVRAHGKFIYFTRLLKLLIQH